MTVNFKTVYENNDLIICTNKGTIIILGLDNISTLGRTAQGVRLINIKEEQQVTTIALVEKIVEPESVEEMNEENISLEINTIESEFNTKEIEEE